MTPFTPFIIGALIGLPLTFYSPRFRSRSVLYRLGVGLLAGIGIGFTCNAGAELLELTGVSRTSPKNPVASTRQATPELTTVDDSPSDTLEPSEWEQEQRYEDGTLEAKRMVTRNSEGDLVPHGPASTYFENGQLKWSGHFEMGNQTGSWEEYYSDGTKEGEGTISADGKAEEKHWYPSGQMKSEGMWKDGVKHGRWNTWHASGKLAGEFHYNNGKLDGVVKLWHPNGTRKLEVTYVDGNPVAPARRWNELGEPVEPSIILLGGEEE